MDATVAILAVLVVVAALFGYLYVPDLLARRRIRKKLKEREEDKKHDTDSGGTE